MVTFGLEVLSIVDPSVRATIDLNEIPAPNYGNVSIEVSGVSTTTRKRHLTAIAIRLQLDSNFDLVLCRFVLQVVAVKEKCVIVLPMIRFAVSYVDVTVFRPLQ